jgi:hypothetical protein
MTFRKTLIIFFGILMLGFFSCVEENKTNQEDSVQNSGDLPLSPALPPGPKPFNLSSMPGTKLIIAGNYGVEADQLNRLTTDEDVEVTIFLKSSGLLMPYRITEDTDNNKIIHGADSSEPWEGVIRKGRVYSILVGDTPANKEDESFMVHVQKKL